MSLLRGRKLNIHDYYKESQEAQNNKENVTPSKNLVGRRTLKTPIIIDDDEEHFVPLTQVGQIVKSHSSSEVERRSSSFELLLKSFFIANKNALNNKNKEESTQGKDPNNVSFEELMNKIITPDLPNLTPNSNRHDAPMISSQTSDTNQSRLEELTNMKSTQNLPNLESTKMETSNSNKINTRSPVLRNKNDASLTPNLPPNSRLDVSTSSNNFDKISMDSETPIAEETDRSDLSFEKLMKQLLTPDLPNPERNTHDSATQTVTVTESGTQTSCDDLPVKFFTPVRSQNSKSFLNFCENTFNNNLDRPLPCYLGNNNTDETLNCTQTANVEVNNNRCTKVTNRTNVKKNTTISGSQLPKRNNGEFETNNEQNDLKSNTNILKILSEDITIQSSKIKFNNIGKIGTDQWLRSALGIVCKKTNRKRKLSVEVYNSNADMNHTNTTVQYIKRCRRGNTKISKISLNDANVNDVTSMSQQYDSNENEANTLSTCLNEVEQKLRLGVDKILTNKDLIPTNISTITQVDKDKMKTTINDLLVKLYAAFQSDKVPFLMPRRRDYKSCIFKDGRLQLKSFKEAQYKRCRPCGKYVYMLYILGKVYSLLESDNQLTKRELYYQVKSSASLKHPGILYGALDEVCCLLNVGRWHLNIVAHSGLVYGDLKLTWSSGEAIYCNTADTMIPFNCDDIVEVQTTAYFILVVEKESIFHKLLQEDLPNKITRPFIMVTGRGVPDFSTLQFLKKITTMIALPVFILVDADIYGIKIMLNYRFGTATNCFLSEYLAVPNARWLGVFPSEISKFGIPHLEMKKTEKTHTNAVLKYPFMESQPMIMQEVELLLKNNKKASIEGLIKNNTFLSESYLPTKFFNQDFI